VTLPPSVPETGIAPIAIEDEMERSYLDYAMSVIVSRALPDVRDGLKPVQRRIIYAMHENGYTHDKPFRKSARIVGDVMGKYHPHGDQAIYDALVRMAQDFAMRLPLIEGQGNFGSMDGDRAAAMRYTESRLARSAHALIDDIDKDTVNFQPNYDDSDEEPVVLPARFPNLLVNGAGGIAVGMATNIPPHNLGEIVDACCALIDEPNLSVDDLVERHVAGPDFPTGATILGRQGILMAYRSGRGSVVMRALTRIEEIRKDRMAIIVDEVPYQVNKARLVEVIADAVRDKRVEGISDLRDESDRDGIRVVIEVKRDSEPEIVLNQLYRYTPLQTSFGISLLALDGRQPRTMNLKEMIAAFLDFREEVIRRRTIYLLAKARDRAHILIGLSVAVANIDEVVATIRRSADATAARTALMARSWPAADIGPLVALVDDAGHGVEEGLYRLTEVQARAILDLRLQRLTGLERDKIGDDLRALAEDIRGYLDILGSRATLLSILREELLAVRESFATPRRTRILDEEPDTDIEDLIQREDMVVTVTNTGYVKRVPLSTYRAQRRGGKGRSGMATREADFVTQVFVVNTHQPLLFFSSAGIVYKMKVYRIPVGTPQARGKAMINLLPLDAGETITTLMPLSEDEASWAERFVVFATSSGRVRRNLLSDFTQVNAAGKIAMKLDPGDRLVRVRTFMTDDDVLLFTRRGQCIRFPLDQVRVFSGRTSTGVRGIKLADGDEVINMCGLKHVEIDAALRDDYLKAVNAKRRLAGTGGAERSEQDRESDEVLAARLNEPAFQALQEREEFLLTAAEDGYGKRTSSFDYRITGRDGSGVVALDLGRADYETTMVAAFPLLPGDQIVMVTDGGQLIRCPVNDIRIAGRTTRGVRLFDTGAGERVVSVSRIRDVVENGNGDDDVGEDGGGEDGGEDDAAEEAAADNAVTEEKTSENTAEKGEDGADA